MNVRRRSTPNSVVKEIHTMVNHYSIRDFVVQLLLATLFILALGWSLSANAQETTYDASFAAANKEGIPINVLVGQSRVINFDRSIGRFSISNPEVAEAVMVSPNQVLVNGKVVLSGTVAEPQSAQQADAVVQAAGFKTVNMLQSPVTNVTQVQLSIRVAEVSRNKLREMGTSWMTAGQQTSGFVS